MIKHLKKCLVLSVTFCSLGVSMGNKETMTATEKIAKMIDLLKQDKTIYIATMTRVFKITPRTFKSWEKDGLTLLKASGNSMYMAQGKSFVCIDYCQITVA